MVLALSPYREVILGKTSQSLFQKLGSPVADWDPAFGVYSDAGVTPATNGQAAQQHIDRIAGLVRAQATEANRPLFQTDVLNGLPALFYDGLNDSLAVASVVAPGDFTVYLVCRLAAVNASSVACVCGQEAASGTPINGRIDYTQSDDTLNTRWRNDAAALTSSLVPGPGFLAQWVEVFQTKTGTTMRTIVNGILRDTDTTAGGAVTPTHTYQGGRPNATGFFNGHVAREIWWNRGLPL